MKKPSEAYLAYRVKCIKKPSHVKPCVKCINFRTMTCSKIKHKLKILILG